jgi:hypothetical protein
MSAAKEAHGVVSVLEDKNFHLADFLASATKTALQATLAKYGEEQPDARAAVTIGGLLLAKAISHTFVVQLGIALIAALMKDNSIVERIEKGVSGLIREPLQTAIEELRLAERSFSGSKQQAAFAESRYHDALRNLDRARSLASGTELLAIRFLQGVAALHMKGAEREAAIHFRDVCEAFESRRRELDNQRTVVESEAANLTTQIETPSPKELPNRFVMPGGEEYPAAAGDEQAGQPGGGSSRQSVLFVGGGYTSAGGELVAEEYKDEVRAFNLRAQLADARNRVTLLLREQEELLGVTRALTDVANLLESV